MKIRPNIQFRLGVLIVLLSLFFMSACTTTKQTVVNQNKMAGHELLAQSKRVLVINSNNAVERYKVAETFYIDAISEVDTMVLDLGDEAEPIEYLQDVLNHNEFDIIYCIGAKALGSIDFIDPGLPVVYSAVLNWRKFEQRENYFGIASELSPQVQLTWFKYFFPEIQTIGVFYSDENKSFIADAKKAAGNLSLTLNALKINRNEQLMLSADKLLSGVDALWLISDSSTLSSIKIVNNLFDASTKLKVPVITYNPAFIDVGAMMSLVSDLPTTARQAAILSMNLIQGHQPTRGVQFPAGSRIILNSEKVDKYDIKLNPGSLDSVDELY